MSVTAKSMPPKSVWDFFTQYIVDNCCEWTVNKKKKVVQI